MNTPFSGRMKYLTLTDPKKVWMPDTFFRNEKTGHFHNILVNNVYIRVFPNGDVLYSIRKVECSHWSRTLVILCSDSFAFPCRERIYYGDPTHNRFFLCLPTYHSVVIRISDSAGSPSLCPAR